MFTPSAIPFTLSIPTIYSECPEQDDINQFICIYPIPVGGGTDEDVTNVGCWPHCRAVSHIELRC